MQVRPAVQSGGFDIDGRRLSLLSHLRSETSDPIAQYALTTLATVPMKPVYCSVLGLKNCGVTMHKYSVLCLCSRLQLAPRMSWYIAIDNVLQDEIGDFYEISGIHAILNIEKKLVKATRTGMRCISVCFEKPSVKQRP